MLSRLIVLGALVAVVSPASAHLRLTSHQARYGDSQKAGPCGVANGERTTDRVYIAKPGIEVMLVWDEFIDHNPSFFRIAFDADGDDDFDTPHLACADTSDFDACFDRTNTAPFMVNGIADEAAAVQSFLYTLPDMECDNCTLQVIQVMGDKPPFVSEVGDDNDIYYQCLDLILSADGPDELTLVETGGSDAGPGGDGDGDGDGGGGGGGSGTGSGGCQTSGGAGGGFALLIAAMLFAVRRRRADG